MAIIDINKCYIKILYKECKLKDNTLYITFTTYPSEAERIKEKNRDKNFIKFKNNMNELIRSLEDNITSAMNTDANKAEVDDLSCKYDKYINQYYNILYNYTLPPNNQSSFKQFVDKDELTRLGFDYSWVVNPVRKYGDSVVAIELKDTDTKLKLSNKFYYGKLKSIMNKGVKDA